MKTTYKTTREMKTTMKLGALLMLLAMTAACIPAEHIGTYTKTVESDGVTTLKIDVGAGDFELIGGADNGEITATIEVYGAVEHDHTHSDSCGCTREDGQDGADPDRGLELVDFVLTRQGDVATLKVRQHSSLEAFAHVHVKVPRRLFVDLKDDSGDIHVEHISSVVIDDSSGDLVVRDVDGDVTIRDDSGEVRVSGVGGDVTIDDNSGDISVYDVAGALEIDDDSGDISVDSVSLDVDINDHSGDICVSRAHHVSVSDRSGDIQHSSVDHLDIERDGSGDVTRGSWRCARD